MAQILTPMAVHAHPDSESSTTGGVLATHPGQGFRTIVVTCTNGEFGVPLSARRCLMTGPVVLRSCKTRDTKSSRVAIRRKRPPGISSVERRCDHARRPSRLRPGGNCTGSA